MFPLSLQSQCDILSLILDLITWVLGIFFSFSCSVYLNFWLLILIKKHLLILLISLMFSCLLFHLFMLSYFFLSLCFVLFLLIFKFILFLAVVGFELKASCLLGKCSSTSIILLYSSFPPSLEEFQKVSFFPFTYMCTQFLHHIYLPTPFPLILPPPTGTILTKYSHSLHLFSVCIVCLFPSS
jgi:hypothetical protein